MRARRPYGRRKKMSAGFILCALIAGFFLPKQPPQSPLPPLPARQTTAAAAAPTPQLVRTKRASTPRPSQAIGREREEAEVTRIVDGDTIEVLFRGQRDAVRFIGVDTPEKRVNTKAHRDSVRTKTDLQTIIAAGKEASAYLGTLISVGSTVSLEFDTRPRDRYGRLLAYVYRADGTMVNEALVLGGYAFAYTLPPDVRYAERFRAAEALARSEHRGLWR